MVGFRKDRTGTVVKSMLRYTLERKEELNDSFDIQVKRREANGFKPLKVFLSGSFRDNESDFNYYEDMLVKHGIEVVRMDKYWDSHKEECELICDIIGDDKLGFWHVDMNHLSSCDVIIMLPGWVKHRGCCMEYGYAVGQRITIIQV